MDLEEAGRAAGLPLWKLELLGQDETVALDFREAARRGQEQAFLGSVDWDVLEARYQSRKRYEAGRFWSRPNMTPAFPEILPMA